VFKKTGAIERGLRSEARLSTNPGCEKRDNERSWGMFYRSPTVGAKCTYQNLEQVHVRMEVDEVGSKTSYVGQREAFVIRARWGTCKTKNSNAQVSI